MPNSWIEEQALAQRNGTGEWTFGTSGRTIVSCRIISAGAIPSTSSNSFWNMVLLSGSGKEADLRDTLFPGNTLPVRPLISNVAAAASAAYQAGTVISVSVDMSCRRPNPGVVTGDAAEDYCEIFPGTHWVVASGSGGASSCAIGINTFGVHFG